MLTYTIQSAYCDGSISQVISQKSCTIPASILHTSPYSLAWGTEVYAKVSASNIYGNSGLSLVGNGGILVSVPDAPVNLDENYS